MMKTFISFVVFSISIMTTLAAPRYTVQRIKNAPLLLATVNNDQAGPFIRVSFENAPQLDLELYARQVSVGTSGIRFHYFAKTSQGYTSLGEFPELTFDSESKQWVSVEKDGGRLLKTTYQIQNSSIKVLTEELIELK